MAEYHAQTVEECYRLAWDEAERYQRLLNELVNEPDLASVEFSKLMAKRNAASRIARLIRYGPERVGPNHEHTYP